MLLRMVSHRFVVWIVSLLGSIASYTLSAEVKPNLILLPIEVAETEEHLRDSYENALVESLSKKYTVFYGAKVEEKLEKEYQKIDCTVESCNQELAIEFQGELIADASVLSVGSGYVIKLKVTNVVHDRIVDEDTRTLPCRECDQFLVISKLQNILGLSSNSKSPVSDKVEASVVETVLGPVTKIQSDARAILIFDSKPTGANVYINNRLAGITPYQGLNHAIGDQLNIKIKHSFYRSYEFNVSLKEAITQLDPVVLKEGKAQLMVLTEPFTAEAVVYVDGQAKGQAPVKLDLTTASHEIYVIANGTKSIVKQVQLKDGESQQLILPFNSSNVSVSPVLEQMGIELINISAGSFRMGSNQGNANEKPVRSVSVSSFMMMKHEVTWSQYQLCINAGVCSPGSDDGGWGKASRPVINVSWKDTQDYIGWLNHETGMNFRLPSEAEWEYAARAGSTSSFSTGERISTNQANFNGNYTYNGSSVGQYRERTLPVGSFQPNEWGLYDMHGNVWEWTQDCWNDSYSAASHKGVARIEGDCERRVLRGGSWVNIPSYLRSANRDWGNQNDRYNSNGFRLVYSL